MAEEIKHRTTQNVRTFLQFGGPSPNNDLVFTGIGTQDITLNSLDAPARGGVDSIDVQDPKKLGQYKRAGRTVSPAGLPSAGLTWRERIGPKIPRMKSDMGCVISGYQLHGNCDDLSDPLLGWDYVDIIPEGLVTDRSFGDPTGFKDDNPIEGTAKLILRDRIYPGGQMTYGADGVTLTGIPITDIAYSGHTACGNCGSAADNGTQWLYASANSATGAKPNVYYSVNGGSSWTAINVTAAAVDDDFVAIAVVGSYLIAISRDTGGGTTSVYYYSSINQITGVPSSTFTAVTSGFVAAKKVNDILVLATNDVYMVADGGYIYRSTDITAGVSTTNGSAAGTTTNNLSRIDGNSQVVVATGASNTVVYSKNGGATWTTTTTSPTVTTGQAVSVIDSNKWWVGGTAGRLWFTLNSGETWTEKTFTGSSAGAVTDVLAVSPEVIFFTHNTTAPVARVFASYDGGKNFTNTAPRVVGLPTFTGATRIAAPLNAEISIAVNNLAIAGTGAAATDGYIVRGVAGVF